MENNEAKTELSSIQSEAIHDILSALNLGEIALTQHFSHWIDSECESLSEDDLEYMECLKDIKLITEEK